EGFHLYDALARCSSHLSRFGGHKHAAGVQLPVSGLQAFSDALEAEARTILDPAQLSPRVRIDAYLEASDVGPELAHELQRLAPFGAGNPEPVFMCKALQAHEVRLLPDKRGAGPGHLKLSLTNGFDAIGFGLGALALKQASPFDAAFQLSIDTWKDVERIQLKLKDVVL
ncbi:MAG TPA: single-stranded-DNA-specific exonuclease RecJ, partial [Myxococcales bacterium]|nr:single-stranded-DNA-specific exonuclease RecJ [Myxococcales bacterium]